MKKKKLTNKEIAQAIDGLSNNDQILWKENLEGRQIFSLYLQYRKKVFKENIEDFHTFVKTEIEKFEKEQRSNITKGA